MAYTPPDLSIVVELEPDYTPPDLSVVVVLGSDAVIDVEINALLPAVSLPLSCAAVASIVDPAAISAALPLPTLDLGCAAHAQFVFSATAAATLPAVPLLALGCAAAAIEDMRLLEASGPSAALPMRSTLPIATPLAMMQQSMLPLRPGAVLRHTSTDPIIVGAELLQQVAIPLRTGVGLPHASTLPLGVGAGLRHQDMIPLRTGVGLPHASTLPLGVGAALRSALQRLAATGLGMRQQSTLPLSLQLRIELRNATLLARGVLMREQNTRWPPPGRSVLGGGGSGGGGTSLPAVIIVPILGSYRVINVFSLVRADTAQPINATVFDATITADDWGWSWSATIPAAQLSRVRSAMLGEYVELLATLNGWSIRCRVERIARSRKFGSSSLQISGRSRAAALADPDSPTITVMNSELRTAQQLINDALTVNGVPLGWTVDWQLEDWPVPAGCWSYTGNYIGAATRVAEAGGGYVQDDASTLTLHILPYYPAAPWDWASLAPDIELPEAVCVTEGIEWADKPDYNAVWVVGGAGGRRDLIERAGSAADFPAPSIVDPLATSAIMTRQQGLRVLADTGRQAPVSVSLPLLEETGVILPGKLLRYVESGGAHLGLSRSLALHWEWSEGGERDELPVRQTIGIETHELST